MQLYTLNIHLLQRLKLHFLEPFAIIIASKKSLIWLQKDLVSIAKQAVLEFSHGVYSHFVSKFWVLQNKC